MAKKTATPKTATAPATASPPSKTPASSTTDATKPKRVKRTKASNIDDVIQLIRDGKSEKAIASLEKLKDSLVAKKERKPRAPTPFNLFVSKKMAELKDSGMTTNERMKECARLWKEQKASASK